MIGAIAGGMAQAYYRKIPVEIVAAVRRTLPQYLLTVIDRFNDRHNCPY